MVEQLLGADLRVDAELLRQVAERPAHRVLVPQHVDLAERDAAAVGLLQRGEDAHQRGLAGAVGPQQPVHAVRDREGDVVQRLHAVGVGLGIVAQGQLHGGLLKGGRPAILLAAGGLTMTRVCPRHEVPMIAVTYGLARCETPDSGFEWAQRKRRPIAGVSASRSREPITRSSPDPRA